MAGEPHLVILGSNCHNKLPHCSLLLIVYWMPYQVSRLSLWCYGCDMDVAAQDLDTLAAEHTNFSVSYTGAVYDKAPVCQFKNIPAL